MLPRKLHLEQVNRFHDKIEEIDREIEAVSDEDKDRKIELYNLYFELVSKLWPKIDDFIEYTIKNKLDILEEKLRKS